MTNTASMPRGFLIPIWRSPTATTSAIPSTFIRADWGTPDSDAFLVDATGIVRLIDLTDDYMLRSLPDRVLVAIEEFLPGSGSRPRGILFSSLRMLPSRRVI